MSHSVKSLDEENLIDSWVDINATGELSRGSDGSQTRSTPISSLHNNAKVEKLLLEAQCELFQSSFVESGRSSQTGSPKSPRSLLSEEVTVEEMQPTQFAAVRRPGSTDWIWDWSSKPDQRPPKEWKMHHPRPTLSLRNSKVAKSGLFSPEMLTIIIVTNLLSLLIGTGFGFYAGKRAGPEFFHWSRH